MGEYGPQPGGTAKASAGNAQCPKRFAGLESEPESDEWPEGKREENTILRIDSGCPENIAPIIDHPLPALGSVEPANWLAAGTAGLVGPRVT